MQSVAGMGDSRFSLVLSPVRWTQIWRSSLSDVGLNQNFVGAVCLVSAVVDGRQTLSTRCLEALVWPTPPL